MWGCFLMSGVKILHFLKDWWKSIPIHQNYTMALIFSPCSLSLKSDRDFNSIRDDQALYGTAPAPCWLIYIACSPDFDHDRFCERGCGKYLPPWNQSRQVQQSVMQYFHHHPSLCQYQALGLGISNVKFFHFFSRNNESVVCNVQQLCGKFGAITILIKWSL